MEKGDLKLSLDWNFFLVGRKLDDCWNSLQGWINEFKMKLKESLESRCILTEFKSKLGKTRGEVYLEEDKNGVNVFIRLREKGYEDSYFDIDEDGKWRIDLGDLNLEDETPGEASLRDSLGPLIKSLKLRLERAQMFCTKCAQKLERGWVKCPHCDTPLGDVTCPECGEVIEAKWISCPNCGSKLRKPVATKDLKIACCPTCGAPITQEIQVGASTIKCQYCSANIILGT